MTSAEELREAYPFMDELIGEEYDEHLEELMPLVEKWALTYHTLEEIGKRPEVVADDDAPSNLIGLDQLMVEVLACIISQDLVPLQPEQFPGLTEEQFRAIQLSSGAIAGICLGWCMAKNLTTFKVPDEQS